MKKFIYIFILCNYFALISRIEAQVPENGLVAYYPFNTNAYDRSGNCTNGDVYGPVLASDRFNYIDAAYHFNGFNTEYINLPGSSFQLQEFTYSAWAMADKIPSPGDFYDILSIGGDDFRDQSIAIRNDGYGGTSYNNDESNFVVFAQKPAVIGQWTHIVMSRSANKVQLFIDGILVDEQKVSNFLLPFYSSNLIGTIGMRHIYSNAFFGKIDDVRIYNRALTSNEVLALYNEHICYEKISVTDTLLINANITNFFPLSFEINIKAYPNPTLDHLIIDAGDFSVISNYSMMISSAAGLEVFQSDINKQFFDLDMNQWKGKGLYLLNLYDSNSNLISVKKIILQ